VASIVIPYGKQLGRSSKRLQNDLLEHVTYLRDKAIIPMLEANDVEFEQKFNEAIKYYSFFTIQLIYKFGINQANISGVSMAKLFLSMIRTVQKEFSKLSDDTVRSVFTNAATKMEDYFLLASDPKINVNKSKYTPILEASSSIWICIMALTEILGNEKYRNKMDRLLKKCQESTNIVKDYVIKIADDHGRRFSEDVMKILDDIDSGKSSMLTQSASEFIKQMRKELALEK
jgi:hypothetical protein